MPKSLALDGHLIVAQMLDLGSTEAKSFAIHRRWIPASMPE
jgi:hypothetical protein